MESKKPRQNQNFGHFKLSISKLNMPISRIAVGNPSEFGQADALKAALAEFISMLIFVFAGEGSGMAFSKGLFKYFLVLISNAF